MNHDSVSKKSSKPANSRLNVLYLILTLKKYSSASSPMSIADIAEKANADYYQAIDESVESRLNNSTVARIMDTLCADNTLGYQNVSMDFYKDISGSGYNIYCVMSTGNPNDPWTDYKIPESGKGPKKYYYYESVFSDAELTALIDAVETYNYFSKDDITGLVSKLLGLRPTSEYLKNYDEYQAERLKDENSLVLANIDEFNRILKANQFAKIEYCSYGDDQQLEVRPGYPRMIRPLSMMWSNGNYYLVALLGKGYSPANLRIDRITTIEPYDPTPQERKDFQVDVALDVSAYRLKHPMMYGGEIKQITMLYNATLETRMNNILMDTFGKLSKIRPATADEIKKHLGNPLAVKGHWLRADFQATEGGAELFATQYCRHCRIISPASLSEKIANNLKEGLTLYQQRTADE